MQHSSRSEMRLTAILAYFREEMNIVKVGASLSTCNKVSLKLSMQPWDDIKLYLRPHFDFFSPFTYEIALRCATVLCSSPQIR